MLFDFSELETTNEVVLPDVFADAGEVSFWNKQTKKQVFNAFESMKLNHYYFFNTRGQFSTYELLDWICTHFELKADLYLTAWTVSEMAARTVQRLKQNGFVGEISALFDYRIKERRGKPFQLMESISSSINYSSTCHAKIMVIYNDKLPVTVVGSGNFSKNPRFETGVVSTSSKVADVYKQWVIEEIEKNGRK